MAARAISASAAAARTLADTLERTWDEHGDGFGHLMYLFGQITNKINSNIPSIAAGWRDVMQGCMAPEVFHLEKTAPFIEKVMMATGAAYVFANLDMAQFVNVRTSFRVVDLAGLPLTLDIERAMRQMAAACKADDRDKLQQSRDLLHQLVAQAIADHLGLPLTDDDADCNATKSAYNIK